ncbi:MAG: LysM peptidoglycan-binding domain-containing protein, partial [bacterium]
MKPCSQMVATPLAIMILFSVASPSLIAKTSTGPRLEPGLERAVKWKWTVEANADSEWGLPIQDIPALHPTPSTAQPNQLALTPSTYEVKKGDVLVRIAKKFKVSAADLKTHNQLSGDLIHIGQILQIPPPQERRATKATPSKGTDDDTQAPPTDIVAQRVFLDRQGFSTGPISDSPTAEFERILQLYQSEKGEVPAVAEISSPSTDYALRAVDFRFIAPPKAARAHAPSA